MVAEVQGYKKKKKEKHSINKLGSLDSYRLKKKY